MLRRWSSVVLALLVAVGLAELSQGLYIRAKAVLAQELIASSWQRTLWGEKEVKPWPWADTWPVARLNAPGQSVELFVLAGASGRTLAFGPGHIDGTAAPGGDGNIVLSGHRDTHFQFLRALDIGSPLVLQAADGVSHSHRVTSMTIVDRGDTRVLLPSEQAQLTLVTCYPFDALVPGGPLRYVVFAQRVS
jgi:sortase A